MVVPARVNCLRRHGCRPRACQVWRLGTYTLCRPVRSGQVRSFYTPLGGSDKHIPAPLDRLRISGWEANGDITDC